MTVALIYVLLAYLTAGVHFGEMATEGHQMAFDEPISKTLLFAGVVLWPVFLYWGVTDA